MGPIAWVGRAAGGATDFDQLGDGCFRSSAISVVSARIRRARDRIAILVAVCCFGNQAVGLTHGRNLWHLVIKAVVVRHSELVSEIRPATVTTRAVMSAFMAAIRAVLGALAGGFQHSEGCLGLPERGVPKAGDPAAACEQAANVERPARRFWRRRGSGRDG